MDVLTSSAVGSSAGAAAGSSIRQCPQCCRDLTLIRIAKPNGCFSEFVSARLNAIRRVRFLRNGHSFGIGKNLTAPPSHTIVRTGRVYGSSAD